eukprot:jgi/Mesvir1/27370/Mv07179-RA.1
MAAVTLVQCHVPTMTLACNAAPCARPASMRVAPTSRAPRSSSSLAGNPLRLSLSSKQASPAARHTLVTKAIEGSVGDGRVMEIDSPETMNRVLQEAGDKLVVLQVSTKTCGPCKMIYPHLVKMSVEHEDAVFAKIMGDATPETRSLMREWNVKSVPLFRFFKSGEVVHSHTGANAEVLRGEFKKFNAK